MQRRCCGRWRKERRKGEGLARTREGKKREKERRKVEGFGQKRAEPGQRKRKKENGRAWWAGLKEKKKRKKERKREGKREREKRIKNLIRWNKIK